jgi:hypothetical protein
MPSITGKEVGMELIGIVASGYVNGSLRNPVHEL